MDFYSIIKRPLVTEKGTRQAQTSHTATKSERARGGSFTFEVEWHATKPQIKEAVERIYNVRVLSVRTSNYEGKPRRMRFKMTRTSDWKKAVVVLHEKDHIDLF